MKRSANSIALISCILVHLTTGSAIKFLETQIGEGRLRHSHVFQEEQSPQHPISTEMSSQIGEPDRRDCHNQSTISSTKIDIKPTGTNATRRAPTTTVRPFHGQIPRPAILTDDGPSTPTKSP